jgi:hypothetical protein
VCVRRGRAVRAKKVPQKNTESKIFGDVRLPTRERSQGAALPLACSLHPACLQSHGANRDGGAISDGAVYGE